MNEKSIKIFNPFDLASDLKLAGVDLPGFITPIHHLFHINRIEEYTRLVKFPTQSDLRPRKMTVYSFFFLTQGSSIRQKGLTKYKFGKNTFFFTPAYEIITHEFISPDAEGYYAHFSMELLTPQHHFRDLLKAFPFLEFNCDPIIQIDAGVLPIILAILNRLTHEYHRGENYNPDILRTYLFTLFTELKQYATPRDVIRSVAASVLTEQYKLALASHIYKKQKVSDYAELLSVTPNHLNKSVRQTLNKSALELLHDMLLLEAKVLLKQTNLRINEIAYKVGRNEATDFARFFKRKTGMSPRAYRDS